MLVGVGAVGNSAAWALARTPFTGQIFLVDPEVVELSNIQRYVLCTRSDEGGAKVEIVGQQFGSALQALPHQEPGHPSLRTRGTSGNAFWLPSIPPMIGEPCKGACHVGLPTRGPN